MIDGIISFAKENGYDSAVYVCKWRKYEVYEPIFQNTDINIVGIPYMIFVEGTEIRMSTVDETFEYLDDNA